MNPRLRRIVDGVLITGEEDEEEKIVDGEREDAGGARERGWIKSQPGTPSSTRGPMRIGGDKIVPLSKTLRNANSGNASRLMHQHAPTPSALPQAPYRFLGLLSLVRATHLIEGGRTMGSRFIFRSTSSINPTFHLSL